MKPPTKKQAIEAVVKAARAVVAGEKRVDGEHGSTYWLAQTLPALDEAVALLDAIEQQAEQSQKAWLAKSYNGQQDKG